MSSQIRILVSIDEKCDICYKSGISMSASHRNNLIAQYNPSLLSNNKTASIDVGGARLLILHINRSARKLYAFLKLPQVIDTNNQFFQLLICVSNGIGPSRPTVPPTEPPHHATCWAMTSYGQQCRQQNRHPSHQLILHTAASHRATDQVAERCEQTGAWFRLV